MKARKDILYYIKGVNGKGSIENWNPATEPTKVQAGIMSGTGFYLLLSDYSGAPIDDITTALKGAIIYFDQITQKWGVSTGGGSGAGALKAVNNLSDVDNVVISRTNLDVYSKSEINTSLNLKANQTSLDSTNEVLMQESEERQKQDANLQTQINLKLNTSLKGVANGLAELDANGFVPSSQLPAYVDDVLEFPSLASFPIIGENGKIYIALDTNLTYRWGGTVYVEISSSLTLGETSSTAYRGDRGKTAYDHSQIFSGNPHGTTKADVGLGNVDNTSDLNKPISTATQTAITNETTNRINADNTLQDSINALINDIVLSPTKTWSSQKIQTKIDGLDKFLDSYEALYIDFMNGDDANSGTITKPFKTFNGCITSFTAGSPHVIYIKSSSTFNFDFRANDQSMMIMFDAKTEHTGTVSLLENNTSIRFLSPNGSASMSGTVNDSSKGTVYFDVIKSGTYNKLGGGIDYTPVGYLEFSANSNIDNLAINFTGNTTIRTLGTGNMGALNQSNGIFSAQHKGSINGVYLTGGVNPLLGQPVCILSNTIQLNKDTNSKSLACSASYGIVYIAGATTLQADLTTYGKIDFTSSGINCFCYVWSNSQLATSGDVFPSTGAILTNTAEYLKYGNFTPLNLIPTNSSQKSFNQSSDIEFGKKLNNIENWDITKSYKKGGVIKYIDNNVYYSNDVIPANTAWALGSTGATWQIITGAIATVYNQALNYSKGEQVVYTDGACYFANADIPANTVFATGLTGATWRILGGSFPEYGANTTITGGQTITGVTPTDINGSSFTIPSAGTWEVSYNVQYATSQTSQNCVIFCADSSNTFIQGSNYNMYVGNANPTNVTTNASMTFRVTTTNATVYKLRANAGSAAATVTIINTTTPNTGSNGSSGIYWKKVGGFAYAGDVMKGATSTTAGLLGAVPTPEIGQQNYILTGGGNYINIGCDDWNFDLSNNANSSYSFYDDYVIFGGGSLSLAETGLFQSIALVQNSTEARRLIPSVQDKIHRLLISYGGENDTTWDQLANINYNNSGLYSVPANVKIGSLNGAAATDVDETGASVASEYFIIPFARDVNYIYFITACYSLVTSYNASFGNKTVQFYTGGDGAGLAAPTGNPTGNTGTLASLRYATSLISTQGISVIIKCRFKYRYK